MSKTKVSFYKEQIEKTAMALSKREFEGARRAILNYSAGFNKLKGGKEVMESMGDALLEKTTTSKDALGLIRKIKNDLPYGKDLHIVKKSDPRYKNYFKDMSPELSKRLDKIQDRIVNNIDPKSGNIHPETIDKLRYALKRFGYKKNFNNSALNSVYLNNPQSVHVAGHELAHASKTPGTANQNLRSILTNSRKYKAEQTIKRDDSKDFLKYIKDGFMNGNKQSKSVGRKTLGMWHEAIKNDDQSLLSELHANALAYNNIRKHLGAEIADKTLGQGLISDSSYALSAIQRGNLPKTKKFINEFGTPIKTKKKIITNPSQIYFTGDRSGNYIRNK